MRHAKREMEDGDGRGHARHIGRARREREREKRARGDDSRTTHNAYTRGGTGARPRKRQTDGFTYL